MTVEKTVYLPVVSLSGWSRHDRPVHLLRATLTQAEPSSAWVEHFPEDVALCGIRDLVSTVREADCRKCLRQRDKSRGLDTT